MVKAVWTDKDVYVQVHNLISHSQRLSQLKMWTEMQWNLHISVHVV